VRKKRPSVVRAHPSTTKTKVVVVGRVENINQASFVCFFPQKKKKEEEEKEVTGSNSEEMCQT